ncbi:hypothetical protein E2C01_045323 [Portunus trituberculatus]|uniref:Uncharacterized protein n=1 Tax=Portunus trituberculatus TaxID=210409 RepID=A0A5B7G1Q6_PORTR|nr:hypothetical protein [Portunus trituberculatus]
MGLLPRLVLSALSHRLSLLEGFARDQTAPGSWAVSSRTLILFVLIAEISATQIGDLRGSVPATATDPSLPAVPSSSDLYLMEFRVLVQKGVCCHTESAGPGGLSMD